MLLVDVKGIYYINKYINVYKLYINSYLNKDISVTLVTLMYQCLPTHKKRHQWLRNTDLLLFSSLSLIWYSAYYCTENNCDKNTTIDNIGILNSNISWEIMR